MPASSPSPWYSRLAEGLSKHSASPWALLLTLGLIAAWLVLGYQVHFPEWWIIAFHVAVGLVTLGLLFLLHHGQRRDMTAIQLKLNELVASQHGASDALVDIERFDGGSLESVKEEARGRRPGEALGRAGTRGPAKPREPATGGKA